MKWTWTAAYYLHPQWKKPLKHTVVTNTKRLPGSFSLYLQLKPVLGGFFSPIVVVNVRNNLSFEKTSTVTDFKERISGLP